MMRAPVMPKGCPRAMAPPLTLSFSHGMPRCLAEGTTWAANASLISTRSMSSMAMPARDSAWRDASMGPRPMISGLSAGDARRDDAGQRCDAQLGGLGVAHDDHGGGAVVERAGVAGGDLAVGAEHGLELGQLLHRGTGAGTVVLADDGARRRGDGRDLAVPVAVLLVGHRPLLLTAPRTRPSPGGPRSRPAARSRRSGPLRCRCRAGPRPAATSRHRWPARRCGPWRRRTRHSWGRRRPCRCRTGSRSRPPRRRIRRPRRP